MFYALIEIDSVNYFRKVKAQLEQKIPEHSILFLRCIALLHNVQYVLFVLSGSKWFTLSSNVLVFI